jgi:hypothetical protein
MSHREGSCVIPRRQPQDEIREGEVCQQRPVLNDGRQVLKVGGRQVRALIDQTRGYRHGEQRSVGR